MSGTLKFTGNSLRRRAPKYRSGFIEAVRAACRAEVNDEVEIDAVVYLNLTKEFSTPPRPGLGDLVAAVATPIARALHLPCIDPATKQLRPDSGCAQRKAALNRLTQ